MERGPGSHLPSTRRHPRRPGDRRRRRRVVYGNTGPQSASGVCFTRDPATGAPGLYGDYLTNAQGEDVVNGSRVTSELTRLQAVLPHAYEPLQRHANTLEQSFLDMCDSDFTIEDGQLWLLQVRVGSAVPRRPSDRDRPRRRGAHRPRRSVEASRWHAAAVTAAPPVRCDGRSRGDRARPRGQPRSGRRRGRSRRRDGDRVGGHRSRGDPGPARDQRRRRGRNDRCCRSGHRPWRADLSRGGGRTRFGTYLRHRVVGLEVDVDKRSGTWPDGTSIREGDLVSVDGTTGTLYRGRLTVRPSDVAAGAPRRTRRGGALVAGSCRRRPPPAARRPTAHPRRPRERRNRPRGESRAGSTVPTASGFAGPSTCSSAPDAS